MAYLIEVQGDRDAGVHLEIAITDVDTGAAIRCYNIDHQLVVNSDNNPDGYGQFSSGTILASNANGRITSPETGVQVIEIPPSALGGILTDQSDYGFNRTIQQSIRCKLLAVPEDASLSDYTRKLADVVISFGGFAMAAPRVRVLVNPQYPILPGDPAFSTGSVQVSQLKIQLATLGQYDAVEAALGGPTSDETILWTSGGTIEFGNALSDVVQTVLGYNDTAMQTFLLICSGIPT